MYSLGLKQRMASLDNSEDGPSGNGLGGDFTQRSNAKNQSRLYDIVIERNYYYFYRINSANKDVIVKVPFKK